jgi:hypothetical protein
MGSIDMERELFVNVDLMIHQLTKFFISTVIETRTLGDGRKFRLIAMPGR